MNMRKTVWILKSAMTAAALALVCAPVPVRAQLDAREEIIAFTEQIRNQPRNPDLYLSRGDLYRAQQNWDAAQSDYDQARTLDPKLELIDFVRGRMFLEANWPLSAKAALDRFLAKHGNHVEALVSRARTLAKLGNRLAASQDYARAIQLGPGSQPELYLERAQTLAAEGGPYIKEALQGIDDGIKKLGPLVTLQLCAIDIEVAQKNYEAALSRVEAVAAANPRKETWMARKGEILRQAGRNDEARAAFQAALKAMETLPPARRNVPAMSELQKRIQEQLANLP